MPADFKKAVDNTLVNINNIFAYLDDILIVTENNLDIHIQKIKEVLLRLEQENLAISLHKCEFAQTEVEWLGFNITKTGTTPLMKKTQAILEIPPPKTLKELRKFMGAIHHVNRFVSNLAATCDPFRELLKGKEKIKN